MKPKIWLQEELRKGNFTVAFGISRANGCRTVEALHADMPMPLGVLWMLNQLLAAYPGRIKRVITGEVNADSGPWAKRFGFKRDQKTKDWVFKVVK